MLLHEAGHMFTAQVIGVRVKGLGVSWKGLYTLRETGSPAQNLVISLAGPFANLALLVFWHLSPIFGLANLCFFFCNLIPIRGSDGDRALSCWQQMQKPFPVAEQKPFPIAEQKASPIAEKVQNRPAA
jgi:Zn-dependent protease